MRDSSLSSLQRVRQPKNLKHQSMINATLKATDAPNALLAARPPVASKLQIRALRLACDRSSQT
ncbi:hypothetical protein D039_0769A, partial [Vibrio parahaemolyticus EKP-028]